MTKRAFLILAVLFSVLLISGRSSYAANSQDIASQFNRFLQEPAKYNPESLSNKSMTAALPVIQILDRSGEPVSQLTDGDLIHFRIRLVEPPDHPIQATFYLMPRGVNIGDCQIPSGRMECETVPVASLGWYWEPGGVAVPRREVIATLEGESLRPAAEVLVSPRPVVMVHGFASSWEAWINYLGPDGYLASIRAPGYAVGDGQVAGSLKTGSLDDPAGETNTIAENAAVLQGTIARVKEATGAQQVDLIAHSMGGLISRYYIDREMESRDVAQLIMLGSPMGGTDCADLPASLGLYLPATLEIRPGYVRDIFNRQITHRRGVPFFALAGIPILEAFKSPCTAVPTDLAVSLESISAVPLDISRLPILHHELNLSEQAFEQFVRPLLQTPAGGFQAEPDPPFQDSAGEQQQFTQLQNGHLAAGDSQEVTVQIDSGVSIASFALFDTSHSLEVTVRGATGNLIELDPVRNGLVVVDDPETMIYLGYGFENPRPGPWQVTLRTTDRTPAGGADWALTARLAGGASLQARASTLLPRTGEEVTFSAVLELAGQPLPVDSAQARLHGPNGYLETLELVSENSKNYQSTWRPPQPGVYGADITVAGRAVDGSPVERSVFLAVEAQPEPRPQRTLLIVAGLGAVALLAVILLAVLFFRLGMGINRKRKRR